MLRYRGTATGYVYQKPKGEWFFIPTCDEVIEWLRVKHDIVIFNAMPPFIDHNENNGIFYRLCIKFCDKEHTTKFFWNSYIFIGTTNLNKNLNVLKRQAITMAINWLLKNKKKCIKQVK